MLPVAKNSILLSTYKHLQPIVGVTDGVGDTEGVIETVGVTDGVGGRQQLPVFVAVLNPVTGLLLT